MLDPDAQTTSELELLDVLEKLPRNILRENIWLNLKEPRFFNDHVPGHLRRGPGRAFRLICRRSWRLSDELTRSVDLLCVSASEEFIAENVQDHSTFLAAQEGLEKLCLTEDDFPDGYGIISRTLHLYLSGAAGAACRRVQILHLDMPSCSSPATAELGEAVQASCPRLSELVLKFATMQTAFLVPLRDCPDLTKVTLQSTDSDFECGEAVGELAMLHGLRSVRLTGWLDTSDLEDLVARTALQELCLRGVSIHATTGDGSRLGALLGGMMNLIKLECPIWQISYNDQNNQDQFHNDLAAQLGGLRKLSSLRVGEGVQNYHDVHLRNGASTLLQLAGLTSLSCVPLAPQADAGAGHLQLLQHLELFGFLFSASSLVASLRQLMPLPALHTLVTSVMIKGCDDAHNAAVAMWEASKVLAQAPCLRNIHLTLRTACVEEVCLGTITALLVPLLERLVRLHLEDLPNGALEVLWPILCRAPRLTALTLVRCSLTERVLLLLGRHMPALSELRVDECEGAGSDAAVALAGLRLRPLWVPWSPPLDPEYERRFGAAAADGVHLEGVPIEEW